MPLLDHFHPPLYPIRHWEAFHSRWANAISDELNGHLLPKAYFAEAQVHVGSRVEVDIATMHDDGRLSQSEAQDRGGVATLATRPWAPPVPSMSMSAIYPDSIEILVYGTESGATVVAAIELVSPGNNDRVEARTGFADHAIGYRQASSTIATRTGQGICLPLDLEAPYMETCQRNRIPQ
jgi:hypothetical protein